METDLDNGHPEGKEKEKKGKDEIEVISTDIDFDTRDEEGLDSLFLESEKLLIFNGSPLLLIHDKISCGASASWWLSLTEFEPEAVVHVAVPRSTYVFLGLSVSQVYLRLKEDKDDESLMLSKQLSEIIGREFALIWREDGLPQSRVEKIDLSLTLMELSIICASVGWAVENSDEMILEAGDAFPDAEWSEHYEDMEIILRTLKESLENVVDRLCTSSLGQSSAKYRKQETYH